MSVLDQVFESLLIGKCPNLAVVEEAQKELETLRKEKAAAVRIGQFTGTMLLGIIGNPENKKWALEEMQTLLSKESGT